MNDSDIFDRNKWDDWTISAPKRKAPITYYVSAFVVTWAAFVILTGNFA